MTSENLDLFPSSPGSSRPDSTGTLLEKVRLGTSGYSFSDWVGPFYPGGLKSGDFLSYYARHFDSVEVNTTYYGIPSPRVMEQMEKKTPPGFHFVVKLNHEMTHANATDPALYRQFHEAIEPLKAAGKYDGLLAQFPWSFKLTPDHQRHVVAVRELLLDEPLHVEFRHDSWVTPELGPWLEQYELGYCVVDEPRLEGLMPPVALVTSPDAYVRLHGRNAQTWWKGDRSTRYDYDYSKRELEEWRLKIQELAQQARRTYLFFNNCHAGQAAKNAKLMQELLRQQSIT
jgi:uncharacterized protein YecE (DUF72 family)